MGFVILTEVGLKPLHVPFGMFEGMSFDRPYYV